VPAGKNGKIGAAGAAAVLAATALAAAALHTQAEVSYQHLRLPNGSAGSHTWRVAALPQTPAAPAVTHLQVAVEDAV